MILRRARLTLVAAALLGAAAPSSGTDGRLQVLGADGRWRTWWAGGAAPNGTLAGAVRWRAARPGLERASCRSPPTSDARCRRSACAWSWRAWTRRVSRSRCTRRRRPRAARAPGPRPRAGRRGAALNAGQFTDAGPWGWVVHRGREVQPPGAGPLSAALVVDDRARARVVPADSIAALRAEGTVVEAVQSYPMLLDGDGALPTALRAAGRGVDLAHRDARLVACELRDGRLLLALTRFAAPADALGDALGGVPLGLTVPETAALASALGCRRAVMLDGGLSAQLLVRDADGTEHRWEGLRRVPLGLVGVARP